MPKIKVGRKACAQKGGKVLDDGQTKIFLFSFFLVFAHNKDLERYVNNEKTKNKNIAMVLSLLPFLLLLLLLLSSFTATTAFLHITTPRSTKTTVMSTSSNKQHQEQHPFCDLPGDPSLILTTNVDLGAKKMEIMKGTV